MYREIIYVHGQEFSTFPKKNIFFEIYLDLLYIILLVLLGHFNLQFSYHKT